MAMAAHCIQQYVQPFQNETLVLISVHMCRRIFLFFSSTIIFYTYIYYVFIASTCKLNLAILLDTHNQILTTPLSVQWLWNLRIRCFIFSLSACDKNVDNPNMGGGGFLTIVCCYKPTSRPSVKPMMLTIYNNWYIISDISSKKWKKYREKNTMR